ncbi:MAG: oligopeptide transport system substrate-binding protein [Woeseiaceae bacterium]|jgi:oligopeptide transport system substrate-binding protein
MMESRPYPQVISRWLWSATVAALLLGGCGVGDEAAVERHSTLNRGTGAEPESLDAHKARTTEAGDVQRDLGEGLVGYLPTGELVAAAAESWEISADGREYTFRLRESARWSNGETVTADDFVYSFRRLVDPDTAAFYAQFIGDIVNAHDITSGEKQPDELAVRATGQFELVITLRNPVPYFLQLLTHPATFPVHRASIEAHGDAHALPENLVTNGAYKLQAWTVGSYIELVRNEHYWNDAATAIDKVRHHVTPQPQAELNRYRAGELDTTSNVAAESFAQMREERADELRVSPALATYYYGFNLSQPPFADNPQLRAALSMAIDREIIAEAIVGRGELPAYGFVPPGVNNYSPRELSYADLSVEERNAKARELYREAGYSADEPLEVELRYNTSESHKRIAVAVQAMWQEVLGVKTTLINEEFQVLLSNVRAAEITQVFRMTWTGDYSDAHTFLTVLESDNPSNMPGFRNAEYAELMQRAALQTDMSRRQIYLEEAERLMLAEHPIIPLYFLVNKSMVSPRVAGWGDNVLNYHYSQHLSLVEK